MSTKINPYTANRLLDNSTSINYHTPMMGNRLKNIMEQEKVTAYRLWKDIGIDQGQLSRFLHGEESISLKKLEQIADYLGYDLKLVKR
ncbi:MAG: helix-turn-helix transcriptional regulator [Salinivirgaceae bacterium]|nr:helix-turn-helix transcriptional regulator [Salinivirgaceae bacterium]